MLDLVNKLVDKLIIYPENMMKNLNLTRGLIFSQTILLKLVNKGMTREDAYKMVQSASMDVWNDKNKNLKDELTGSKEISKYLTKEEIEEVFNSKKMLKNIDYIFNRSIYDDN